ncbi:MAG: cobalamin biosynthesis protein CobD [Pseudomonadota bacterium]
MHNLAVALPCALAVPVALAWDRWLGEPPTWAHPVVGMGRALGAVGPRLLAWRPLAAFIGGMLAWCVGAALVMALAWALQTAAARHLPPWAQALLLGIALKPLLAWRLLRDEVAAVEAALAQSLSQGRAQLARLVSRDVTQLDATTVRESALETLAENLNDSVVAPLFWFALAGLPGAALYRFANTADAMWGYRGRWEWAGKWAARCDDALSWLPARLTALLLAAVAGRWPRGLRAEAQRTPSPCGGWPMGAMALLLKVRLHKPEVYALNASGRAVMPVHTDVALAWSGQAAWLAAALSALVWALRGLL